MGKHLGQYLVQSINFISLLSVASLSSELELSAKKSAGGAPRTSACFPKKIPGRVAIALNVFIPL